MSWVEAMKRDAIAIASDDTSGHDYEYREGDEVFVNVDHDEGYAYSEYTWDSSHTRINVYVLRDYERVFDS